MKLRAAFMGSPAFAVPSLHAVADACSLEVVVCQPDRPAGRGRKLQAPAVKTAALERGLPVLQPTKVRDGTLLAQLQAYALDIIVVTAYGRILPRELLELPREGCINVHASMLPRWRGAAPIQRAVLAGDAQTGVSIMRMEEGLDTGPVYCSTSTPIGAGETSGELFERLARLGGELLRETLRDWDGGMVPTPQDDSQATHAAMLSKAEGAVDWSASAATVYNHVRGMDPWPCAWTQRGTTQLRLFGARVESEAAAPAEPGVVVDVNAEGLAVSCGEGVVRVAELQPAGKRRMAAHAYATGHPFESGERLL